MIRFRIYLDLLHERRKNDIFEIRFERHDGELYRPNGWCRFWTRDKVTLKRLRRVRRFLKRRDA